MKEQEPVQTPKVGQRVRIETIGLPEGVNPDKRYWFNIHRSGGVIVVHVPGHNRGPDNCEPHDSQQEAWLDGLTTIMRRSWGCQWTIHDQSALERFVEMLRPVVDTYQVVIG